MEESRTNEDRYEYMLINLETLELEEIKGLLGSAEIPFEMEKQEDQLSIRWGGVNGKEFDFYVMVDKDRDSLRFYGVSILSSDELKDATKEQIMETVNFMNIGSNTTKYALIGKKFLTFEYGMLLFGSISSEHIIKIINTIKDDVSSLDVVFDKVFKIVNNNKKEK